MRNAPSYAGYPGPVNAHGPRCIVLAILKQALAEVEQARKSAAPA
jgi:hypothetical protein